MPLHPEGQRLQSLENEERVEGRYYRALVAQKRGAHFEYIRRTAAHFGEHYAVVCGIGLGKAGELARGVPVEFAAVHHYSAHSRAVAAHELCCRVHDYVCTVLERPYKIGRGESRVHNKRYAVFVRDRRYGLHVNEVGVGVAHAFGVYKFCIGTNGFAEIFGVGLVDKSCCYALLGKGDGKEVVRAAVEVACRYDVIAAGCNVLHGVGYGRRAARHRQSGNAAFERGNALFKHVGSGVGKSGVDVAPLFQVKTSSGLRAVFKNVGSRHVYGYGACACCGVGLFLTCVYGKSFKSVFIVLHNACSFKFF